MFFGLVYVSTCVQFVVVWKLRIVILEFKIMPQSIANVRNLSLYAFFLFDCRLFPCVLRAVTGLISTSTKLNTEWQGKKMNWIRRWKTRRGIEASDFFRAVYWCHNTLVNKEFILWNWTTKFKGIKHFVQTNSMNTEEAFWLCPSKLVVLL